MKLSHILIVSLKFIILAIVYLLCIPAVYFITTSNSYLAHILTWGFICFIPILLIIFRKRKKTYWNILGGCIVFLIIFFSLPPSNNRNWNKNVSILPSISIDKNLVTIGNIRNFKYKTEHDYIQNYYDKTFNIDNITTLDYILSYWDGNKDIAHTMLSFGFKNNSHLCVSVETRGEVDEPQTGLRGLYNQYELIYILADEKDILGLRTNYRKEEVYIFPMNVNKEQIQKLFIQIMSKVQKLQTHPQFYNTIKNNCFTSLLNEIRKITQQTIVFDWRFLKNGRSDELGYERNSFITNGMSFNDFKYSNHINQYILTKEIPENYSVIIRQRSDCKSGSR